MKYQVTVAGRTIEVEVDGERVTVGGRTLPAELRVVPGTPLRHLLLGGRSATLPMRDEHAGAWEVTWAGEAWPVEVIDERTRHIRSLTAGAGRAAGPAVIKAPMPGLVVRILVEPGSEIAAGAGVAVLEAMKMENELRAPAAGTVQAVRVEPGQAVEKGQVLVELA